MTTELVEASRVRRKSDTASAFRKTVNLKIIFFLLRILVIIDLTKDAERKFSCIRSAAIIDVLIHKIEH